MSFLPAAARQTEGRFLHSIGQQLKAQNRSLSAHSGTMKRVRPFKARIVRPEDLLAHSEAASKKLKTNPQVRTDLVSRKSRSQGTKCPFATRDSTIFSAMKKGAAASSPRPEVTSWSGWNVLQIIHRALPLELANIGDQRIDVCFG
jgi:hypothetical protein